MGLTPPLDLRGQRVLIFIVAYNAETTIEKVLSRIPASLAQPGVEVLIIDDASKDSTFRKGLRYQEGHSAFKITVLRTSENQGYGGNQKLGYRYAIDHHFDIVALVHGDGQYAPEKLPALLEPLLTQKADAVFGSRMIDKRAARAGGMPLYKWLGNQVLTKFQNRVLGTTLSEFHSGYRLYSTKALAQVPFEKNTQHFHFDTEIIIQFVLRNLCIAELSIPTYYGDEVCHVNGIRYAWDIFKSTIKARLCQINLLYDAKYDAQGSESVDLLKLGYPSSHTAAIAVAKSNGSILDMSEQTGLTAELARKGCQVTTVHRSSRGGTMNGIRWESDYPELPASISAFDQVFLLDVIEHLREPARFIEELRLAAACKRPEIILTTANVGFFITRLMLLFGYFNYGRKGILDATHTRLFTFGSLSRLLRQSGYRVLEMRGIPAPFPKAIGHNFLSRSFLRLNSALIGWSRGLFSYQIFVRAQAMPTVENLLGETICDSAELSVKMLHAAA